MLNRGIHYNFDKVQLPVKYLALTPKQHPFFSYHKSILSKYYII